MNNDANLGITSVKEYKGILIPHRSPGPTQDGGRLSPFQTYDLN
jgi:hypothetical protein